MPCDPGVARGCRRRRRPPAGSPGAARVGEELVHVEAGDLSRDAAHEVVGHPSAVLAALVAVERLLEVPELVLLGRGEKEAVRLHGVVPDEREPTELDLHLPGPDVLVHQAWGRTPRCTDDTPGTAGRRTRSSAPARRGSRAPPRCCGIPPRSTTGVAVGGGESELLLEITATAMRAAAAAIAMPKATTTGPSRRAIRRAGFIAAISRDSVPAGRLLAAFGAGYTGPYTP